MSNSIGIGVLGCGRIGVMHAELIAQRIEGAHLAGVYDVVTESAKKIATKFNCKHFESPDALMSAKEVDAIAICTTTDTHVEVLLMASKYRDNFWYASSSIWNTIPPKFMVTVLFMTIRFDW